jgi:hypothetical protein
MVRTAESQRPGRANKGLPSGQDRRLRARIEMETEGVTLVSKRHKPPAIPVAPLQFPAKDEEAPKGASCFLLIE